LRPPRTGCKSTEFALDQTVILFLRSTDDGGECTGVTAYGGRVFGIRAKVDSAAAAAPNQRRQTDQAVIGIGGADFGIRP
jgi:protein involved in ribonucleotide reduction